MEPHHGGPPPRRPRRRAARHRISRACKRCLLKAVLGAVVYPRRTLLLAATALVFCCGLAYFRLSISTDQNRLFSSNVKFFRDWLEFDEKFPENQALYLIVLPRDASAQIPVTRWTGVADAIAARLATIPKYVKRSDARIPLDKLGAQAILFQDPDELKKSLEQVRSSVPLARLWGERPTPITAALGNTPIERFLGGLRLRSPDSELAGFVSLLAQSWDDAVQHPDAPPRVGDGVPDLKRVDATPRDLGYYYEPNADPNDPARYLLLVRVYPRDDFSRLTAVSETVSAIRRAAREAAKDFPEFKVGATGRPALDADEMEQTDRDSKKAEVCAGIAVFLGLVVMLRSIWLALAAELSLGVGIGWTFGWATVTIGELNLLSIVFLIALIGIGMDYLVQILTRYREERLLHARPEVIWAAVFRHVGPPINTACLGAAGAFLVSALTDFRGAAELGIIAGGGLLLCLLAGYTVLPAMLTLFPGKLTPPAAGPRTTERVSAESVQPRLGARWLIGPAIWLSLLAAGVAWFAPRTHFDPGLLNLQSQKAESVKLVHKLQTWSAALLSRDLSVLRTVRDRVKDLPVVASTDSILNACDNYQFLHDPVNALPKIAWAPPRAVKADDLPAIALKARAVADRLAAAGAAGATAARSLRSFAARLDAASSDDARRAIVERLSRWQEVFLEELRGIISQFDPPPPDIAKLPDELRSHFVSGDGNYALYINPKEDLWDQSALKRFVKQVEGRVKQVPGAPDVTGIASDIYHSTASIEHAFYKATSYALALILFLVMLDLRRVGQTLLAVSVLAMGLPMLVALMGAMHVSWNFANFFGLPILIGAGHEYGVFLVHRFREARRDPRRAWRRWDVSDRALLLCAYVTSSSFGFFWALANHVGLRSLGLVMALGTACIYLSALLVLRPILLWWLERETTEAIKAE